MILLFIIDTSAMYNQICKVLLLQNLFIRYNTLQYKHTLLYTNKDILYRKKYGRKTQICVKMRFSHHESDLFQTTSSKGHEVV